MQRIPLILHQTWKSHTVPSKWADFVSSFVQYNPEFERRLWSDGEARELVANEFPELLDTYDAYPYAILRADLFRYLVLYVYGGIYADLDIAFFAPVASLLKRGGVVLATEPFQHAQRFGHKALACNAFMASEPGHPFWLSVIQEVQARGPDCVTHLDVLELTGPLMLQRVLDHHRKAGNLAPEGCLSDITLLAPEVINPLSHAQLTEVRSLGKVADPLAAYFRQAGAVGLHVWSNSWCGTLAGDLDNPEPYKVPGFVFFEGLDSHGGDIANLGRKVSEVARICLQMSAAVAFNTDGFVKRNLRPRSNWSRLANRGEGQGIYVKREHAKAWWRLPLPQRWRR